MTPQSFLAVKRRALAAAVPLSVHMELTYRCPWRCHFCYNPRRHDLAPLTLAEWEAVFDDLRRLGTLFVTLTGGEPLAHPDAVAIARAARARALAVRLLTNGHLIDATLAAEIAALHPLSVELSLHGAAAGSHDAVTGIPGSFERLLAAVRELRRHDVPTMLKVPYTRDNQDELERIIALAGALGVPLRLDPTLVARDGGDPAPLQHLADAGGVRRLYRCLGAAGRLPAVTRTPGGVACGLGRLTLAVDPEGNVFPCLQWRHSSLGNVRSSSLLDLWRDSPVRREAAAVASEANERLRAAGAAAATAHFCPAAAALAHGDPYRTDEAFQLRARLAHELRSAP